MSTVKKPAPESRGPRERHRLYATPRSPFARRIRLALARLGLDHELVLIDAFAPTNDFLAANPLGLVPVLLDADDGCAYPDSNSILEVLHLKHGSRIWPAERQAQLEARRLSTLAVGVMTAAVARVLEKAHESPDPAWLKDHEDGIQRTVRKLAEECSRPAPELARFTQADWDLAVMLEYLDLRFPEWNWRTEHPGLESWLKMASKSPVFIDTRPPPA